MSSGNISADYSVMLETSNTIINDASLIKEQFGDVETKYDSLNSYWESSSATLFAEHIANLIAEFEPMVNGFSNSGKSLRTMIENYEDTDSNVESSVDTL